MLFLQDEKLFLLGWCDGSSNISAGNVVLEFDGNGFDWILLLLHDNYSSRLSESKPLNFSRLSSLFFSSLHRPSPFVVRVLAGVL